MNNEKWNLFISLNEEEKKLAFWLMCAIRAASVGCDSNKMMFREVQAHPKKDVFFAIADEAVDHDEELYEAIYNFFGEPPYDMEANF